RAAFPNGDGGGNSLTSNWGSTAKWDKDLHALLDAGAAQPDPRNPSRTENNYKEVQEPLTAEGRAWIENRARQIQNQYPKATFSTQQLQDQNPTDWVRDLGAEAQHIWP